MGQQRKQPTVATEKTASTDALPTAEDTPVLGMPDIGLVAQPWPVHCLALHEVEEVVRHPRTVPQGLQNLACSPKERHRCVRQ